MSIWEENNNVCANDSWEFFFLRNLRFYYKYEKLI